MKKLLILSAIMLGLMVAPIAVMKAGKLAAHATSTEAVNENYQKQALPSQNTALSVDEPKIFDVQKTINLEDDDTVVLKGPVTDDSVSAVEKRLQEISLKLSKNAHIRLVLDTPGGDITAGSDLIDFAKALPQKVDTISLFAASMGFQIAENLNTRYITRTGVLMSHRARLGGLEGQINGEFESRYKMIRRQVDFMELIASKRMGIDLETYRKKIVNELWVYGFDALEERVADETVAVTCGKSMTGSYSQVFNTMMGPVKVTFNKCPLIKAPESVELSQIVIGEQDKVEAAVRMAFNNQKKFVDEYITTNRFFTIFK
jgi:ATP-dependent protease ClpP protease subunit